MRDIAYRTTLRLTLSPGLSAGDGAFQDGPDFAKRAGAEDLGLIGKPFVNVIRREVAELACAQSGDDVRVGEDGALGDGSVVATA